MLVLGSSTPGAIHALNVYRLLLFGAGITASAFRMCLLPFGHTALNDPWNTCPSTLNHKPGGELTICTARPMSCAWQTGANTAAKASGNIEQIKNFTEKWTLPTRAV